MHLGVTREDNIKVERAGVKRAGSSWFRVDDQRRALVQGNKFSVPKKPINILVSAVAIGLSRNLHDVTGYNLNLTLII